MEKNWNVYDTPEKIFIKPGNLHAYPDREFKGFLMNILIFETQE